MKKSLVDVKGFEATFEGTLFFGNAVIFWTYVIIFRKITLFGKVLDPWAQGLILGESWASKYRVCQQNQSFRNTAPD